VDLAFQKESYFVQKKVLFGNEPFSPLSLVGESSVSMHRREEWFHTGKKGWGTSRMECFEGCYHGRLPDKIVQEFGS
jgi:hypothetical protein